MPFMKIDFQSEFVGRTNIAVYYPAKAPSAEAKHGHPGDKHPQQHVLSAGEKYQTLWLLHGSGGDFSHWPLNSTIKEISEKLQLVVIMPTVQDFIAGQPDLGDFFREVSEELPGKLSNIFPLSRARDDNFICGLSYGGYLSYRIALTHPETFSCAGSLSSPINVIADVREKHLGQYGYPDPDTIGGTDRDVIHLARELKQNHSVMPELFQACGTEDFTWEYNMTARNAFYEMGVEVKWVEFPGVHNFDFWNAAIRKFLEWLPLEKKPVMRSGNKEG